MICPACGHSLTPQTIGQTTVDTCAGGCGGIWFDNFELARLDEPHDPGADVLLAVPRNEKMEVDLAMKRNCPRCHDQVMRRRFSSRLRQVEIDECPACAGVWLDAGELVRIRAEVARAAAAPKKRLW